jgi:hypothetical protein
MKHKYILGLFLAVTLVTVQNAKADVVLLKAGEAAPESEEDMNHLRYEREVASLNNVSDQIAYQIFNKKAHPNAAAGNKNDNLQVKLIKIRR